MWEQSSLFFFLRFFLNDFFSKTNLSSSKIAFIYIYWMPDKCEKISLLSTQDSWPQDVLMIATFCNWQKWGCEKDRTLTEKQSLVPMLKIHFWTSFEKLLVVVRNVGISFKNHKYKLWHCVDLIESSKINMEFQEFRSHILSESALHSV